jgi:hypothetical protein
LVDSVFGGIESPSIDDDWRSAMRRRAISAREAVKRHSWAIGVMEAEPWSGQPAKPQRGHGCLREPGFSFETAIHAHSVQDAYSYGFALQEKTLWFEIPDDAGEAVQEKSAGDRRTRRLPVSRRFQSRRRDALCAGYGVQHTPRIPGAKSTRRPCSPSATSRSALDSCSASESRKTVFWTHFLVGLTRRASTSQAGSIASSCTASLRLLRLWGSGPAIGDAALGARRATHRSSLTSS